MSFAVSTSWQLFTDRDILQKKATFTCGLVIFFEAHAPCIGGEPNLILAERYLLREIASASAGRGREGPKGNERLSQSRTGVIHVRDSISATGATKSETSRHEIQVVVGQFHGLGNLLLDHDLYL